MSEYINKIIIPTLEGECEISLDHKANVNDVYNKNETYNKEETYSKEEVYNKTESYNKEETYNKKETYNKTETKDIVNNSSDKSAELLINVLLAYNSLGEGQSLNILSDWPIDGATGLDIINDNKGLKGIALYNSGATNNTKVLYTRDNLIYSESTSSFTIRINGGESTLNLSSPKAYTDVRGRITSMKNMFNQCTRLTSLDLSNFDTSNVTDMYCMFYNCIGLTSLDLSNFDTSHVTGMNSMFSSCSSLTSLDLSNFDTSSVNNMGSMFYYCFRLTSLDLSNFDTSQVTSMHNMFENCRSLTTVIGPITGIKCNLLLQGSPLTADSAMVFINGLSEVTKTKVLRLKSTTYDSLTREQKAIATSKGWNVIRS